MKQNIKKILFIIVIVAVVSFGFYTFLFISLGNVTKIDLMTLGNLTSKPLSKKVVLRFSKGWQLRTEYIGDSTKESSEGIIVKIKNTDKKSMVVSLSLDPYQSVFFNCDDCKGFIDILQSMEERIVYDGPIKDFVGKVVMINNKNYLKTSFVLSFETSKELHLKNPINVYAYIPSQTL